MSMMRKRFYRNSLISILTGLLICNLTGCMLLPKEEQTRKVAYAKSDELEEYSLTKSQRMDLEKTLEIPCVYRQLEEESLSFHREKEMVVGVYVSKGQFVKKGMLLASLDTSTLKQEINMLEDQIEQAKQAIDQLQQKAEYDKKYIELDYKYKRVTKVEHDQTISTIEDNLETDVKSKSDEIYILNMRLEDKNETLSGSTIVAPMDGMISFVRTDLENSICEDGVAVIKLINPEKCAFEIYKSEETSFLHIGQTYSVESPVGTCEGTLLPPGKETDSYIYLKLNEIPGGLVVGDRGVLHYLADSKMNALVLPTAYVHDGEGFKFVYMLDENNIKVIRKVEVGLQTVEFTEIVSGLDENDSVIEE